MSGVNIQRLAAAAPFSTRFADNFNRANTAFGYGNDWVWSRNETAAFASYGQDAISSNQMQFGANVGTINGAGCTGVWIPAKTMARGFYGSQFAQATFVSNTPIPHIFGTRYVFSGPVVLHNPNSVNTSPLGYLFVVNRATPNQGLIYTNTSQAVPAGSPVFPLVNPGDVIRMEATVIPATTTIQIFYNGVLQGTCADSSATRSSLGFPGMGQCGQATTAGGATMAWDDFSCGPL